MTALDQIDTIVLVMLENRSFDHRLGHLSYGPHANGTRVEGLTEPLNRNDYANVFEGEAYYPRPMKDNDLSTDLPHRRRSASLRRPTPSTPNRSNRWAFGCRDSSSRRW